MMPIYVPASSEEQEKIKASLYQVGLGIIFNIVSTSSHLHRLSSNVTICNLPMINDPNATTPKWKPARTQAITCARCIDYAVKHDLNIPVRENTRHKAEKRRAFERKMSIPQSVDKNLTKEGDTTHDQG